MRAMSILFNVEGRLLHFECKQHTNSTLNLDGISANANSSINTTDLYFFGGYIHGLSSVFFANKATLIPIEEICCNYSVIENKNHNPSTKTSDRKVCQHQNSCRAAHVLRCHLHLTQLVLVYV